MYQEVDPQKSIECVQKAIDRWKVTNIRRAATQEAAKAEVFEKMGQMRLAAASYAQAAKWFRVDKAGA